jgi:hypothetical protein
MLLVGDRRRWLSPWVVAIELPVLYPMVVLGGSIDAVWLCEGHIITFIGVGAGAGKYLFLYYRREGQIVRQ